MSLDSLSVFSSAGFEANEYANTILASESQPTSVVISKLSFAIDDTSKQIKNLVATHHESLLAHTSNVTHLKGSLGSVKSGLNDLESSLEKLRLKIRVPYQSLQENLTRLQKLQQASDVLRRASRFVILARRLQVQIQEIDYPPPSDTTIPSSSQNKDVSDFAIAKAALSIAELASLTGPPLQKRSITYNGEAREEDAAAISLRAIDAIAAHIPFVEEAHAKVTTQMETMITTSLATLNQSMLASSLQAAYNLQTLPQFTRKLVIDLSQAVEEKIRDAFDIAKVSKDALAKELGTPSLPPSSPIIYRSRVRTEPTSVTAPQFMAALWSRLEAMIEEMADCCVKVYTLEKVLKLKKDVITGTKFLDEAMKSLDSTPASSFWMSVTQALEKSAQESAKNSSFLQQTLCNGYPKLLRLFQEFFGKIALHTDVVYSHSYQSAEAALVIRSLSNFEALYLSKSSIKLNEAIAQAVSGGVRSPPGYNEGMNIARTITNELDSAKFDPFLGKSIAKIGVGGIDLFLSRIDGMVIKDRSATVMLGPTATPQSISNAQLASCLYQCWHRLDKLKTEQPEASFAILQPSIQKMWGAYDDVMEPVRASVRRELGAIVAKLHRVDFGKTADPMAGMGSPSAYMKELVEKLSFIKMEVFDRFSIGEAGRTWLIEIVRFVMRTFVLHVSIARPLTEMGKLQLTSDMTELEFGLSAFMVDNPQSKRGGNLEVAGDDYRALRALRPLLFLSDFLLAEPQSTVGLSPLIVLHHIIVRSPLPLPHELHGWQEAEYVRWVDEHTEQEALTLIEGGLVHWEKISEDEGKGDGTATEYVQLARVVLGRNL